MVSTRRVAVAAGLIALGALGTVPATAHADENRLMFVTPSGNIRCAMDSDGETPYVACQLENTDYVVAPGDAYDDNGAPCPSNTGSGNDLMLEQGQPGHIRCSYASIGTGVSDWTTLAYGESTSYGPITCVSESSALTCTDTSSGHFFRVSRLEYQVG